MARKQQAIYLDNVLNPFSLTNSEKGSAIKAAWLAMQGEEFKGQYANGSPSIIGHYIGKGVLASGADHGTVFVWWDGCYQPIRQVATRGLKNGRRTPGDDDAS